MLLVFTFSSIYVLQSTKQSLQVLDTPCRCPIHLPQETSLFMKFYIWCIFSLSALHPSLNKMFCWLERKLFDPFNGHLSSDKLHLHSVKSLKFPFFSPVANWRRSPLITSSLGGHSTALWETRRTSPATSLGGFKSNFKGSRGLPLV